VRLNDPELVAREYASEDRFLARRVVFRDYVEGPKAEDLALAAVRDAAPRRVLEVGCGPGDFAVRVRDELGADIVALDLSPRMVELARARGLDARVGDTQELPLADGTFDCAVANWVLHHAADLDRAAAELARVLRPGGRLVAATFGWKHLAELYDWLDAPNVGELEFARENGEALLRRHFAFVERRDADATVVFPGRAALHAYLSALMRGAELAKRLPTFDGPFQARSVQSVFVAEKAA
jgi:SAM-dependent methyltransferase